jgi:DNA-binding MarR family transcriptional regulator
LPDDQLGRIARRLMRVMHLLDRHDHGGVRVTLSEIMALGELASGPLTQNELGERLALDKSTVSRLAGAMEERGWIARERDPVNRRYARISLTDAGRAVGDRVASHLTAMHSLLLAALTSEEREGLLLGLRGVARIID